MSVNEKRSEPFAVNHKQRIDSILRVDHAGEYAATKIYEGQLAVFSKLSHKQEFCEKLREMEAEEHRHLGVFNELLVEREARPSLLSPLWEAAGFALGVGTALMGERAAMACTAAVEEVIGTHYQKQEETLARMEGEESLRKTVDEFRQDELEHRATALDADAESAPGYVPLTRVIQGGCRLAIKIAEKI